MTDKELLARAKAGRLTSTEAAGVAKALDRGDSGRNTYTFIHILGRAYATQYESLVLRHLTSRDPMVASIALRTLCIYWGLTEKYLDDLVRIASQETAEEREIVRQAAMEALGEFLRNGGSSKAIDALLRVFDDPRSYLLTRQAAYFALARAMGRAWSEMPPASRLIDFARDVDPQVIAWARARASRV